MSIKELIKYRGWKVWQIHDMHISLLAIFYILIVDNLFRPLDSLILISSLGFYFMYGFLINDFYDMPYDIKVGKKRVVQELPKGTFIVMILVVVFISALHLLYLKTLSYVAVYTFFYILATLYSAPVIGFKRRTFAGIITNALIEKMLPVLAIFSFFKHLGIDTLIFLATSFLLQIVEIMTHQIYDYEADLKAGIHSFVVDIGIESALKVFRYFVVPFSMVFIILLCSLICMKVPYAAFVAVAVFMIYLVIFLSVSKGRLSMEEKVFPLYLSPLYFVINNALPPFLALILSIVSPLNIILLLVAFGSQYYLLKIFLKTVKEKVIPRTEIEDT